MSSQPVLDTIASYLPALVVRRLVADPTPIPLPSCDEQQAAVLFADISGFTALTERLAARGAAGAEQLTGLLNTYFGRLIDIVTAHGGDVVKFAGDALLAVWQGEDLATLALRAAQCALLVQETLRGYQTPEGVSLALRIAVGAGLVRHLHVGGVFDRCEFLTVGDPLADVGAANKQVRPEDVVIAPRAWRLIAGACEGEVLPSDDVRLLAINSPLPPGLLARPRLSAAAEPAVRRYLPAAVRTRLEAGQTDWVGELRPVTVLFVNLPGIDAIAAPTEIQTVMCELQKALYHYEGSINKLSVDDKGVTLVAALGLPPLAHENDPILGVEAALAMHARVAALGGACSVGVTSGRAFCGTYGSPVRREYTLIGKVVNLAARLMQAAHGGIYCDEATWRMARERIRFETLPPILVKGRTEPVPVFRPLGDAQAIGNGLRAVPASSKPLVGRRQERQALLDRLQALCERGEGSVVVIEGEAGIGKSRLVRELAQQARTRGVIVLSGGGDAINKATPYFAWRPIFLQLFQPEGQPLSQEALRQRVLARLGEDPDLPRLAPLLEPVLPGEWPDNEITAQMTGEVRADNTNRLLLRLLAGTRGQALGIRQGAFADNGQNAQCPTPDASPMLLTLDDCQWLDSASWTLARLAGRDVPSLLLVLSTRPLSGGSLSARSASQSTTAATAVAQDVSESRALLEAAATDRLRLDALSAADTTAFVCQLLGVRSLPTAVTGLIYERAQGNPFFSGELAYALRDTGLIQIEGEECRLVPGAGGLSAVALPDTVQGVVTSRVDRLNPAAQLALKVASVIGQSFSLRILSALYPIESDRPSLPAYLLTLQRLDLTRPEVPDPDPAYSFKHTITREAVYNLMLVSQRRDLHRAAAEWYERHHADDLAPLYALLAYHWGEADVGARAVEYLEKAGEHALRNHANEEAISFFTEALARDDGDGLDSGPLRRARWERQLGEAYYAQGNSAWARVHLERAVDLLGFPVPASRMGYRLAAIGQLLRQFLHRALPRLFVGKGAAPVEGRGTRDEGREKKSDSSSLVPRLEAARCYEGLTRIYYLNNARIPCLHGSLRALNLAESAGPSPELAHSYANASVVFGLLGLRGIADAHARRAAETAERVNQLTCTTYVLEVTGLHWYCAGCWEQARAAFSRAAELAESISDVRRWDEVLVPLAMIPFHHGDFRTSASIPLRLLASARRRGILQVQCWALSWRLVSLLPLGLKNPEVAGQVAEAVTALEALLARASDASGPLVQADLVLGYGALARAYWRQGKLHQARQVAEKGVAVSSRGQPISHYTLEGYAGLLEVCTGLWEKGLGNRTSEAEGARLCRPLSRALRSFAGMHLIGVPQAWLWDGLCAWLSGRRRRAQRSWNRSLAAARRLGMPHDEAQAHHEIGRHATPGDPARQTHLGLARDLFARLGAAHGLARTEQLLVGQGVPSSLEGEKIPN